jgi:GTPase SAR1 family protein
MLPQDIIIAVMGITGAGKTTFISRCMGEDVGIGHGLHSYTQDVAIHSFRRHGRVIRLIDTPGFDDTSKADVNILNNIAFWMSHAYRAEPKLLLSGIIYLHPISETRMAGSATKNLEMMKLLCGDGSLSAVWLATTMWNHVSGEVGARREYELTSTEQFWGSLIRCGSSVHRHQDSDTSAFAIIDSILQRNRKVTLTIQRQMVDNHLDVDETDAGRYLCRTVHEEQRKVRDRLARSAEELEEKLESEQAAEVEEVLERQQEYQRKLEEKDQSLTAMRLDMERLREAKAREFQQREQDIAKEKKDQEAKMAELDCQVRDLQTQRDAAVKHAEEAAASRSKLEDSNLQLILQRDQAAIAEIDRAIAEHTREEERVASESKQTVKKENIFKHTMKVSMADSLVHGAFHVAGHVLAAACVVM